MTSINYPSETNDSNNSPSSNLEHEITLLRVMIRRTMELADSVDNLYEATRVLDALGTASSRLANLLRAQKSLSQNQSQLSNKISIAIQEMNAELRRKNVQK